jgi:IS1 family transposase
MRLPFDRAVFALRLLLEGTSVRSVERLTGTHRDTIISALVVAGNHCKRFLETVVHRTQVNDVQADEIWAFVGCKEKTRERENLPEDRGDSYTYTAIERTTKLILAWHLGKRCPADTLEFAEKLRRATQGRFQLTTDGYRPYLNAIPFVFGPRIDFATVTKVFGEAEDERRYSPPRIIEIIRTAQTGSPDPDRVCTSHVERSNLTIRMTIRRFTRLTNAFSKKWSNHEAALALFFAYYNFCRVHSTLKSTPAVQAGLTDHAWGLNELLETAAGGYNTVNGTAG